MNAPDLETRIRSYYRTFEPKDSARLMLASRTALEQARRPRSKLSLSGSLRLAATVAAAAVLLAVLVLPRFGLVVEPRSGASFDPEGAWRARAEQAGLMRSGGIWAVSDSYLLTSTDNGASWRAGGLPASVGTVFVLDPDHAWAIDVATAMGTGGAWYRVVYRTSDGGKTWLQTSTVVAVTGADACEVAAISFVDAEHGFLMCSMPGEGTILRTEDGGASWSIVGQASGLGPRFTASDANTLWSAEYPQSAALGGIRLHVSRDGGSAWSTVDLPELSSVYAGDMTARAGYATGTLVTAPTFADGSHGALAVVVVGQGGSSEVWFYRTSDAGRSWILVKKPFHGGYLPVVGRVWALCGSGTIPSLIVSTDYGTSWTDEPGHGLPNDPGYPVFRWVDFTDDSHGAALVFNPDVWPAGEALMVTADGGRTWRPADFGDARAKVTADPSRDIETAQGKVSWFEAMAHTWVPEWATSELRAAWLTLAPYSQQSFGSFPAFKAAEDALRERALQGTHVGTPTQSTEELSLPKLGAGLWADLTSHADMTRAYVVPVAFADSSVPPETFVVAPLSSTGEWRIWVVTMP